MTEQRRPLSFLEPLLAPALGLGVARSKLADAARDLRFSADALTQEEAFSVLEALAQEKGIVGSSARFAKVRLALLWG